MRTISRSGLLDRLRVALVILGTASCLWAQAPNGDDGGPPQFAGGQMVRGIVTAVASKQLTLKTEAGEVYQVALSDNTRLMKGRQAARLADIKPGDGAGAMGVLDLPTKTVHAVMVAVMDAEDVKKAREGMGKVYIVGKVTAIDELKLTVMRSDGVSQVIEVDEGTSFKRGGRGMAAMLTGGLMGGGPSGGGALGAGTGVGSGSARQRQASAATGGQSRSPSGGGGESITLADIKVGNTVAGKGELKHGTFVPTELGVADPAAMAARRRRPNQDGRPVGTDGASATPPPPGTTAP